MICIFLQTAIRSYRPLCSGPDRGKGDAAYEGRFFGGGGGELVYILKHKDLTRKIPLYAKPVSFFLNLPRAPSKFQKVQNKNQICRINLTCPPVLHM